MESTAEYTYYALQNSSESQNQMLMYPQVFQTSITFQTCDTISFAQTGGIIIDGDSATFSSTGRAASSSNEDISEKFKMKARVHKQFTFKKLSKKHDDAAKSWRKYKLISWCVLFKKASIYLSEIDIVLVNVKIISVSNST